MFGAYPPKELRHKFLMAQNSHVLPLEKSSLPEGLETLPLPGHTSDMVGFRTAENVVFLADSLSSRETLEKYRIVFLTDVRAYLETLRSVQSLKADLFIPSHTEPTDEIAPLAEYNAQKVYETADAILQICSVPSSFEAVLKKLFELYHLTMTFEQHALVGSTVRSYLAWLHEEEKLSAEVRDNTLVWYV